MNGVTIIGTLLRAAEPVTNIVAAKDITAGLLNEDAPLPSLLVRSVSTIERLKLRRTGMVRLTERVRVTARTKSHADLTALLEAVTHCCAGKVGSAAGGAGVSILNAGAGPDVIGPNLTFERSADFRVSYETAA